MPDLNPYRGESPDSPTQSESLGLSIPSRFEPDGRHPFEKVEWERRDAVIEDEAGHVIFEQKQVEFPKTWSQSAAQIVASKYFHGSGAAREDSLKTLIARVADTLTGWGETRGYFAGTEAA